MHQKRLVRYSEPNEKKSEALRLSEIKDQTGNNVTNARGCYESGTLSTFTELHATIVMDCNEKPALSGRLDRAVIERFRVVEFEITFTTQQEEIDADPVHFKPVNNELKAKAFQDRHRCALFKYILNSSDDTEIYFSKASVDAAMTYIADQNVIMTWFEGAYVRDTTDEVQFTPVKDIFTQFQASDAFLGLSRGDQPTYNLKRVKTEFERSNLTKDDFKTARTFIMDPKSGVMNNKIGLAHWRPKKEDEI